MRLPLLSLVAAAACTAPVTEQGECRRTGAFFTQPWNGFGIVGERKSVVVAHDAFCKPEVALTATVSVLGPDQQPVAVEAEHPPVTRGTEYAELTLSFVPQAPGGHHVTVRFEPNLGTAQLDVDVGVDRRSEQPRFSLPALGLQNCEHVDVSPGGRLLCLAPRVAAFPADAGSSHELSAQGIAARSGPVLWVADRQGALTRWVEGATGFTQEPAAALATPDAGSLLPSERDVLVASADLTLTRVAFEDGGLTAVTWPTTKNPPLLGVARDDTEALLAGSSTTCNERMCFGLAVCHVLLATGTAACQPLASLVEAGVGSGASGVWLQVLAVAPSLVVRQRELHRVNRFGSVKLVYEGNACFDFCGSTQLKAVLPSHWDTAPWLQGTFGAFVVPTERGGRIDPDAWLVQKPVISVTSAWVTAADSTGVEVYAR